MEKQKTVFKEGDKVYDRLYGWGKVITINYFSYYHVAVYFNGLKKFYEENGALCNSNARPSLSFTEYTLQGFSQERPIDYNEYIGKLGMFWHTKDQGRLLCTLEQYNEVSARPFISKTWADQFTHFKPLTEEQIKILEL